MKKTLIVTALLAMLISSFTACGKQSEKDTSSSEGSISSQTSVNGPDETSQPSSSSPAESETGDVKTLEGTLSGKKDFMYIITDDQNNAYVFPIDEEHPTDLTDINEGDKITMTYTGALDLSDTFAGEVLSITKS